MHAQSSDLPERAIVLQVLRDDHQEWWSRAELERSIEPGVVRAAVVRLEVEGVVVVDGETVSASRCARHLDALGLISV